MELYEIHLKKAISCFKVADHLTYVTLPLVHDNKLIITILENINLALIHGMNAVLEYEKHYKRVLLLNDGFEFRYEVFTKKIIGRYGFIKEDALLIYELRNFVKERKEAPIEFTRVNKFVICSDNYRMKTVSIEDIKKYLLKTKTFLLKAGKALKK